MISRLWPIDLTVSYANRTDAAGEPIQITVEGTARRDCYVGQGRVELKGDARWTDRSTRTVETPIYQRVGTGSHVQHAGTRTDVKETVVKQRENRVQASVVFLEDAPLTSGEPFRHSVELQVPAKQSFPVTSNVTWTLQTVVSVAGARDVRRRSKVSVRV